MLGIEEIGVQIEEPFSILALEIIAETIASNARLSREEARTKIPALFNKMTIAPQAVNIAPQAFTVAPHEAIIALQAVNIAPQAVTIAPQAVKVDEFDLNAR